MTYSVSSYLKLDPLLRELREVFVLIILLFWGKLFTALKFLLVFRGFIRNLNSYVIIGVLIVIMSLTAFSFL